MKIISITMKLIKWDLSKLTVSSLLWSINMANRLTRVPAIRGTTRCTCEQIVRWEMMPVCLKTWSHKTRHLLNNSTMEKMKKMGEIWLTHSALRKTQINLHSTLICMGIIWRLQLKKFGLITFHNSLYLSKTSIKIQRLPQYQCAKFKCVSALQLL